MVHQFDEDSGRRQGLFQAAASLSDSGVLSVFEEDQLSQLKAWFGNSLKRPHSFAKSRKPYAANKAISWFRDSAALHIAKMYELAAILESHGLFVEVIKTERPGYVVYEDQYQVTAEPYFDTKT